MTYQDIITNAFETYGQNLTITTAGSGRTIRALMTPMDNGTVGVFFDANEQVGLYKPSISLFVPGSETSPPVVGDTFTDGDYPGPDRIIITVQKVQAFRIAGVIVLYLALCD